MYEWNEVASAAALDVWAGCTIFMGERLENTRKWGASALEQEFHLQFNQSRLNLEKLLDLASQAERAPRQASDLGESGSVPERGAV